MRRSLTLVACLTLAIAPLIHAQTTDDVTSRARNSYYNLPRQGFKGFTAKLEPNWEVILGTTATRNNLKVFRDIKFSIVVDEKGIVTVTHKLGTNAAKPNLQNLVQKIHSDIERLIMACFATWRMFMITSPFLGENSIKIAHSGDRFEISYAASAGNVTIKMTESLLITEYSLVGSTSRRIVKPRFEKDVDGLILTGYESVFEPVNAGKSTNLEFRIEYQSLGGMKLPSKIAFSGTHREEPVAAEVVLRVN